MDAGLDDKRWFSALAQDEFVIRASHLERIVAVYHARRDRWEREVLGDLVAVVPFAHTFCVPLGRALSMSARSGKPAARSVGFRCVSLVKPTPCGCWWLRSMAFCFGPLPGPSRVFQQLFQILIGRRQWFARQPG